MHCNVPLRGILRILTCPISASLQINIVCSRYSCTGLRKINIPVAGFGYYTAVISSHRSGKLNISLCGLSRNINILFRISFFIRNCSSTCGMHIRKYNISLVLYFCGNLAAGIYIAEKSDTALIRFRINRSIRRPYIQTAKYVAVYGLKGNCIPG